MGSREIVCFFRISFLKLSLISKIKKYIPKNIAKGTTYLYVYIWVSFTLLRLLKIFFE